MAFPTLLPRQDSSSTTNNEITLALTTVFSQPSNCPVTVLGTSGSTYNYWIPGSDRGTTTFFGSAWSCYPEQFYLTGGLVPLYSPGACPADFLIVAATSLQDPDITYATCCPTDATTASFFIQPTCQT